MRRKLVVGNWKMHGSLAQSTALLQEVVAATTEFSDELEISICPSYIHLGLAKELLQNTPLLLGAQDLNSEPEGPQTGEVSASMLADFGASYVIVGHSERREIFQESDQLVAVKIAAAQATGLTPILCIGESLEQRQQGLTEEIVIAQLSAVIDQVGIQAFNRAVIAYEPIWAIGTGQTASPTQAQEVHWILRDHLAARDAAVAGAVRIIYGGSVKADNAKDLFLQVDIDGGLVGGASLKAEEFISICKSAD
ncbi:MAG: triose-phosphate isomerase [Gammaproteobacteria bacterium]|jgi:triosephosphate isomerase|nr:triose-phosphate isomerase [Gammaproteobacteria bacterium]|tara:strand:- start:495 stop:1250 length:756 start_codon:yes stop_codon:yes gene_type:complete